MRMLKLQQKSVLSHKDGHCNLWRYRKTKNDWDQKHKPQMSFRIRSQESAHLGRWLLQIASKLQYLYIFAQIIKTCNDFFQWGLMVSFEFPEGKLSKSVSCDNVILQWWFKNALKDFYCSSNMTWHASVSSEPLQYRKHLFNY